MKLNSWDYIIMVLLIVGGLNWGLVGFMNYDLISAIFGAGTFVTQAIFALIGVSAVYMIGVWAVKYSETAGKTRAGLTS